MTPPVGRFAPSPTGPLHLGSLATALGSYLDIRTMGGEWLVRIEDIDPERCKPEYSDDILATLHKHGLYWDGEVLLQSQRQTYYQHVLDRLTKLGRTYPCGCTRKDLEAANANRPFGQSRVYPGTCRHGIPNGRSARAIRFVCPTSTVQWQDLRLGRVQESLAETSGDFVLKRGDGHWAYHLVVVVDDIASGVNHIVRGEDLADTTARQLALYDALEAERPTYWHLPVILAEDGQKLSKQTGAQALDANKAIDNLDRVWQHFGLPAINAKGLSDWLEKAKPIWLKYRELQKATERVLRTNPIG